MKDLSSISIQYVKGVGPARKKLFENLGVQSIEDLLYLFPRRYEDRRVLTPIADLKIGEYQSFRGEVIKKGARRSFFNKKHVLEVIIQDGSARVFCVWFNQGYLDRVFHDGDQVVAYGKVDLFNNKLQVVCPEYEIIKGDEFLSVGRIVPIYPLTRGITQRTLRKIIHTCLELYAGDIRVLIPSLILNRQKISGLRDGLRSLHFPQDDQARFDAERSLSFHEFFLFQIAVILRRMSIFQKKGVSHAVTNDFLRAYVKSLPFVLTKGQKKAMDDIVQDLRKKRPMLRLLQGDVGCGKTVVSFLGCLASVAGGHQAAVMAPTEILAEQHYQNFSAMFGDGCMGQVRTAILNSRLKKKERAAVLEAIGKGEVDLVFGTHALIQQDVNFKDLSFVVVDEQHKFGVKQRALLSSKGINPDVLVMTATPIPRTLCLTLYGDLDVSTINEKPKNRGEIKTYRFSQDEASGVYKKVADWVKKGTQAYIVYPIIEESETLDLKSATDMYKHFQKHEFKDLNVGLIHGQLKNVEAEEVMKRFKEGKIKVLVTTTVLEVGIDVPNANIMVIENAERFGLSQLHQLRGRIGRSDKNALCMLLTDPTTEDGKLRMDAIVNIADGFQIAEKDLEIRGPGQYFGHTQHGLNELRVVHPLMQMDILEAARQEAMAMVKQDPQLKNQKLIYQTIQKRYPDYLERILAG